MGKHCKIQKIIDPNIKRAKINEAKLYLFKKCSEISLLYNIQIFMAITDENNELSVLSTKTDVSEYISHTLTIPLKAKEIFTSKSVNFYIIKKVRGL